MGKPVYDWISSFVAGVDEGRDGVVILTDQNFQQKSRTDFQRYSTRWRSRRSTPPRRRRSRLTLKFTALTVSTKTVTGLIGATLSNQRPWLPANFRLDIDGLDTTKVSSIDGFAVTQKVLDGLGGGRRRFTLPQPVVSDVRLQFAQTSIKTWTSYLDGFLDGIAGEVSGRLDVKNSTLSTVLASIGLSNLGLVRLDPDPVPSGDQIRRATAELYCEEVSFTFRPKP